MGGSSYDYSSSSRYDFSRDRKVTTTSAATYAQRDQRVHAPPARQKLPSAVGRDISSQSKLVMAVILDVTGSMKKTPGFFIERMSTMYAEINAAIQGQKLSELEAGKKLGDLLDVGVVAIGDASGDKVPFQVLNYCKGAELVRGVNDIFPEGQGGGNAKESYDLGAYYLLKHSKTPNVPEGTKPLLVIIGDEGFYPEVNATEVKKYIGDDLPGDIDTKDVMKQLAEKFDTYLIRTELNYSPGVYANIHKQWQEVLGDERVMKMEGYDRLVDNLVMICGYCAKDYKNAFALLERRQIDPKNPKEGLGKLLAVLETQYPLIGKAAAEEEKKRLEEKYLGKSAEPKKRVRKVADA